ncbi:LysR family transcriptional regulator, partial [Streptomyces sp. NPDC052676]|uniref:LysR family transcriptional regulator n=1 Tax=Streptomyces sp. NPDC052676 TaxID=3154953 RepID=UPI003425222A
MDPHLLRTYVTVARLASFSAAARELGYTQSAVSQHIAALEQDLGAPLLTRRPVTPTAAGERLIANQKVSNIKDLLPIVDTVIQDGKELVIIA